MLKSNLKCLFCSFGVTGIFFSKLKCLLLIYFPLLNYRSAHISESFQPSNLLIGISLIQKTNLNGLLAYVMLQKYNNLGEWWIGIINFSQCRIWDILVIMLINCFIGNIYLRRRILDKESKKLGLLKFLRNSWS